MCIVSLLLITLVVGIIAYSENIKKVGVIENIKRAFEEIAESSNLDNKSNVTVVDVTDLKNYIVVEHEHVYKTMYDENSHWNECMLCGEKQEIKGHIYTTTWALGYESCDYLNSYGNGSIYNVTLGKNGSAFEYCYSSNGTKVTCKNGGQCVKCGRRYNAGQHQRAHFMFDTGKLTCACKENYSFIKVFKTSLYRDYRKV